MGQAGAPETSRSTLASGGGWDGGDAAGGGASTATGTLCTERAVDGSTVSTFGVRRPQLDAQSAHALA
jgi:hypothetical protein